MIDPLSSPEAQDRALLEWIQRGSFWLRAVSCTLARRGARFRQQEPARARALLDELARSPLCKGGQFLFDLLEWEDFMLDGTPPTALSTVLDGAALQRISGMLHSVQAHLDGATPAPDPRLTLATEATTVGNTEAELPALEGGFYLYQDVLLGILESARPLVVAARQ